MQFLIKIYTGFYFCVGFAAGFLRLIIGVTFDAFFRGFNLAADTDSAPRAPDEPGANWLKDKTGASDIEISHADCMCEKCIVDRDRITELTGERDRALLACDLLEQQADPYRNLMQVELLDEEIKRLRDESAELRIDCQKFRDERLRTRNSTQLQIAARDKRIVLLEAAVLFDIEPSGEFNENHPVFRMAEDIDNLNKHLNAFMPIIGQHYRRKDAEHKTFCDACRYWEILR